MPGDEVGIFSERNLLCGAATFTGGHLAVAIWGDEPSIAGLQGMRSGEKYEMRVWSTLDKQVYPVLATRFTTGDGRYEENDIEIAEHLLLGREPLPDFQLPDFQVFPNPGRGYIHVLSGKAVEGEVVLRLTDLSGRVILEQKFGDWPAGVQRRIAFEDTPSGIYILQLAGKSGIWTEKVQIVE